MAFLPVKAFFGAIYTSDIFAAPPPPERTPNLKRVLQIYILVSGYGTVPGAAAGGEAGTDALLKLWLALPQHPAPLGPHSHDFFP